MTKPINLNDNDMTKIETVLPAAALIEPKEEPAAPDTAGQVQPVPKPEPDPYSYEALRMPASAGPLSGEPTYVELLVRRPRKTEWVRTHGKFIGEFAEIFDSEDSTGGIGGTSYIVSPAIARLVPSFINTVRLYVTMNRQEVLFLWRIAIRNSEGQTNLSAQSQDEAACYARDKWIRIQWSMGGRLYLRYDAPGDLPEPVWPEKLPDLMSFVKLGYRGRILLSLDDPVARRIIGKLSGTE